MSRLFSLLFLASALFAQAPRVTWSGYIDKGIEDSIQVVAPAPDGSGVWVAGNSASNFTAPGPNVPFQSERRGDVDVFVAKYKPEADGTSTLLFWTWLGGGARDAVTAMKIGPNGRLYLTGFTESNDFPLAGEAFQIARQGGREAWIAVIDPTAEGDASLLFSTYYGGTRDETPTAIAIGPDGSIVIVGSTDSDDLPNIKDQGRVQETNRGGNEIFLVRCDLGGVLYATYFGGRSTDGATGVVVDRDNNIWFSGWTASDDFPATENALQNFLAIHFDAFVAKIDTNVSGLDGLMYCTYYGGGGTDVAYSMAIDELGALWVGGYTTSNDFPTANAFQPRFGGFTDTFVFRMIIRDTPNPAIVYSTYFGGLGHEVFRSLAPLGDGRVALTGYTMYGDLPVTPDALLPLPNSSFADGYLAILDSTKSGREGLIYSSYVGAEFTDVPLSVALAPDGALFLGGYTNSYGFPSTDGSFRSNPPTLPSGMIQRIERSQPPAD
jgi:hypothetical protein